ncbi:hypothetical protein [Bradyrhizobium lablabi]|uniref:hypothetical protein n=1 Tax=Bradyrhizobium lablabi TaxID=722472 RepID=UPI000A898B22|nr:hypothetical protein [Bradyrhizobium lablabi]
MDVVDMRPSIMAPPESPSSSTSSAIASGFDEFLDLDRLASLYADLSVSLICPEHLL